MDATAPWHITAGRLRTDPPPGTATEADLLCRIDGDDRWPCELIDGSLVDKPASLHKGVVAAAAALALGMWSRDYGDTLIVLNGRAALRMATTGNVRLPDACGLLRCRLPGGRLPREKVPSLAPDVAVEILSESNTRAEMRQKLAEYFANGTRLAWLIDPRTRTVAVHTTPGDPDAVLADPDAFTGGEVLPGFTIPVATLFHDLPD